MEQTKNKKDRNTTENISQMENLRYMFTEAKSNVQPEYTF